ncbi:MAG: hypothetical protein AAGN15_00325 [Cyanobacteria bacterium J06581_3]
MTVQELLSAAKPLPLQEKIQLASQLMQATAAQIQPEKTTVPADEFQNQQVWGAVVFELLRRTEEPTDCVEGFKNALLDAIERANPNYTPAMTTVLFEGIATIDSAPIMNTNEFREWLTRL